MTVPSISHPLSDWLNYLGSLHVSAIDMGLSRVLPVAQKLGLTKPTATVFTVAGTNGKGSTTASIAKICEQAGYKTALYQSPHVIDFNERVQINHQPVGDDVLIAAFAKVDAARVALGQSLSFFEATTLAAMLIFKEANCAVWVLEVGLGGRLDVVNIIDPDVAVITNVGIDHVDWLGSEREKIGYEKAGILRKNIPCVLASNDMPASVWQKVRELGCPVFVQGLDYDFKDYGFKDYGFKDLIQEDTSQESRNQADINQKDSSQPASKENPQPSWLYSNKAVTLSLPMPSLALENVAAAVTAVLASTLHISHAHISQALENLQLLGRFYQYGIQLNGQRKHIRSIFDAAHNPDGVQFLLKRLLPLWQQQLQQYPQAKLHIVLSMLADKDIRSVVTQLAQALPHALWYIAPLDVPRAASTEQLQTSLHTAVANERLQTDESIQKAVLCAYHKAGDNDMILVCGSFHTIAAALTAVQDEKTAVLG